MECIPAPKSDPRTTRKTRDLLRVSKDLGREVENSLS
jgi:hypothetical protein